jgi:hypothetical protein
MTRHSILLFLLLAIPSASRSQMIRGWGVEGGASGGYQLISITSASPTPAIPRTIRWGFSAGAFVEFLNMQALSVIFESGYAEKGRKITSEEVAQSSSYPAGLSPGPAGGTPKAAYVHIGLLVKMRSGRTGFVPFVVVGPRFDFLVGRGDDPSHVFDNFKRSDIGASVGGGIDIVPRRSPILSLQARWSPSFSRAFTAPAVTIRNQAVDLILAVWL